MTTALPVLFVGLEPDAAQRVLAELHSAGLSPTVSQAQNQDEFLAALEAAPRLIICRLGKTAWGASEVLRLMADKGLSMPIFVVAKQAKAAEAASCLRSGAWDFWEDADFSGLAEAANEALQESADSLYNLPTAQENYRALIETMNEGVMAADRDTRITFVNPALCRLLGYTFEELMGRELWELIAPADLEMVRAQLARRRLGESSTYETNFITKQGETLRTRISAVPLLDEQGKFVGSNAIITDLSDLHRAEAGLRKAAEEWRHSFDSIDEMMMITDRDYKIRRCNRTLADQMGVPIRQVLGKTCYELVHGTAEPPVYCPHQRVITSGEPEECEVFESHLNRSVQISIAPIKNKKEEVSGTVHIVRDVTEKRAQEKETLRLSQALVESFQATTLALTSMVESRDPYTSGHTQGVAELCEKVGHTIGMSEDDIQGIIACALLHDIGKGAIPLDILNKPGELTFHEMGIIKEHPTTAYHILQGISFPWPVAEVVWQHHERLDGSGYPRNLKHDAMHPWSNILAVCDVVEAMTSHRPYRPARTMQEAFNVLKEGAGNKFEVRVVAAAIRALGLDNRRLMVVDDDPGVLQVLTTYLEREGLQVKSFSDPAAAVEEFQSDPTPVVLTDLKMPGISGLEVLKTVKDHSPESEVIVITGHGDKASVVSAMRMGASDFLEKPVKMSELADAVERARRRFGGGVQVGDAEKNGLSQLLDR